MKKLSVRYVRVTSSPVPTATRLIQGLRYLNSDHEDTYPASHASSTSIIERGRVSFCGVLAGYRQPPLRQPGVKLIELEAPLRGRGQIDRGHIGDEDAQGYGRYVVCVLQLPSAADNRPQKRRRHHYWRKGRRFHPTAPPPRSLRRRPGSRPEAAGSSPASPANFAA